MTIALPKGDFLVTAGFAAIAGAGVASSFTVFDNASTWYLVLVAVVTLGVTPFLRAGYRHRSETLCSSPSAYCSAFQSRRLSTGRSLQTPSLSGPSSPSPSSMVEGHLWHSVWAG